MPWWMKPSAKTAPAADFLRPSSFVFSNSRQFRPGIQLAKEVALMQSRIDYRKFAKEPIQALLDLESYLSHCGLETNLIHLIKLRASQINGCAFCIDMHWKDARAGGETEQRLYGLDAWRESPYY